MKFLVYVTRTGAENRSRSEAQRRNCGPATTHWWGVVEGAAGDFACEVPDDPAELEFMSAADRSRLKATFSRKPPEGNA